MAKNLISFSRIFFNTSFQYQIALRSYLESQFENRKSFTKKHLFNKNYLQQNSLRSNRGVSLEYFHIILLRSQTDLVEASQLRDLLGETYLGNYSIYIFEINSFVIQFFSSLYLGCTSIDIIKCLLQFWGSIKRIIRLRIHLFGIQFNIFRMRKKLLL